MTQLTRLEADRALRIGIRDQITALWASMAFMDRDERKPIYSEIRVLRRILAKANRMAK